MLGREKKRGQSRCVEIEELEQFWHSFNRQHPGDEEW